MKEAFAGVRAEAAMMRSPSFSRWGLSRTRTNSPAPGKGECVLVRYTGGEGAGGVPKALMAEGMSSKTRSLEWSAIAVVVCDLRDLMKRCRVSRGVVVVIKASWRNCG